MTPCINNLKDLQLVEDDIGSREQWFRVFVRRNPFRAKTAGKNARKLLFCNEITIFTEIHIHWDIAVVFHLLIFVISLS